MINLYVNVSSSSLLSLRIKLGDVVDEGSGSCVLELVTSYKRLAYTTEIPTCTYSTMLLSPRSREADTFVAGNALGTTFKMIRRRELVTVNDDIETVRNG